MINFTLKFESETIKGSTPSDWSEVTTEQFLALELSEWDLTNPISVFSLLSKVPLDALNNTKTNLSEELYNSLHWVMTDIPNWTKIKKKKKIKFMDKVLKVPGNLELERFGQKVMLQQLMEGEDKNLMNLIPKAMALYFQPLIDGSFINDRLSEVEKEVLKMPILESYAITAFFFLKFTEYQIFGPPDLQQFQ